MQKEDATHTRARTRAHTYSHTRAHTHTHTHTHPRVLLSPEKQGDPATCNNVKEPGGHQGRVSGRRGGGQRTQTPTFTATGFWSSNARHAGPSWQHWGGYVHLAKTRDRTRGGRAATEDSDGVRGARVNEPHRGGTAQWVPGHHAALRKPTQGCPSLRKLQKVKGAYRWNRQNVSFRFIFLAWNPTMPARLHVLFYI